MTVPKLKEIDWTDLELSDTQKSGRNKNKEIKKENSDENNRQSVEDRPPNNNKGNPAKFQKMCNFNFQLKIPT